MTNEITETDFTVLDAKKIGLQLIAYGNALTEDFALLIVKTRDMKYPDSIENLKQIVSISKQMCDIRDTLDGLKELIQDAVSPDADEKDINPLD